MPRVMWFEIPADDPERAKKFYEQVFGWKIEKWEGPEPYWLVKTGEEGEMGIDGGLMPRVGNSTTQNTVGVPDVDEYVKKVVDAGGKVVLPKMAVPGMGWLAYVTDTEGNIFGVMQPDMSAK
jgi:predicted enzyme related to lactoylglutathione lyase